MNTILMAILALVLAVVWSVSFALGSPALALPSPDDRYFDGRTAAKPVSTSKVRAGRSHRHVDSTVHGGRPAGCPARAWCGCFLSKYLGLHRRDLWLARNWARIGSPSSARPGVIAVWRHHVGKVVAVEPGRIKLLSGNDGRAVRERWRSARGVIAYRAL